MLHRHKIAAAVPSIKAREGQPVRKRRGVVFHAPLLPRSH